MSDDPLGSPPPLVLPGAQLAPLRFADLPGWTEDDHAATLATFARSCDAMLTRGAPRGGPAREALGPALVDACRAVPAGASPETARAFFERRFAPYRVVPDGAEDEARAGFVTAYFEPVRAGLARADGPLLGAASQAPIRPREARRA